MLNRRRRIKPLRDGTYQIRLEDHERALLRTLIPQLRDLLEDGSDPTLWRLFPNAYADDERLAAEYQEMVGDDLLRKRLGHLDVIESTLDESIVDAEQLEAWMGAVNDIRLVIGTRLDVDDEVDFDRLDPDGDDALLYAAYGYLGWLMEHLVAAVTSR